jgi:peptidoglycan hydrolase-like protein with peptidoglycan-binding domain
MEEGARKALINNALSIGGSVRMGDVAEVQTMLQALGLYSGPVDGAEGPALSDAIRRFQQENGLVPDGYVGPRTYTEIKRRADAKKE